MHPRDLSISEFTYDLPEERIAKYPLPERDMSKLLVWENGKMQTCVYRNIDEHLSADSLLIFNNTKVIEARLLFKKETGGVIEVFCLEPHEQYGDITTAMLQKEKVLWKCFIGGASKWKHGVKLKKVVIHAASTPYHPFAEQHSEKQIFDEEIILEAAIADRLSDCFVVELVWEPKHLTFAEVLHYTGAVPLPPYLHRQAEEDDKLRYQTIYALHEGSVAAPTAGLHFTDEVFKKLAEKNITTANVTLHVGAGTFKPVKSKRMNAHEMHAEWIDVAAEAIEKLIAFADKNVVAVGTTSLRTIESLYWIGVKIKNAKCKMQKQLSANELTVHQWEPYETDAANISAKEALTVVLEWMKKQQVQRLITKTQILIAPGYELKIAKGIITNFHQPQSTLLLLIAAVVGDDWKRIYNYALNHDFRFLSYGDGCLLWKR